MTATLFLGWVLLIAHIKGGPEAIPMNSEAACISAAQTLTGKGTAYYRNSVFCINTETGETRIAPAGR